MVLPLKSQFTVFDAIVATETSRIPPDGAEQPEHASSIILEIVGADTPSWTLDIQGRTHPSGTFTAVDYIQIWQAGAAAQANAQISITDTTARFYLIPNCPNFLQLIATRTTGNLTVHGSYTSEVFFGNLAIGGDAADDAADSGNPVKIGGKAVTGAPSAVSDADRVDAHFDEFGKMAVMIGSNGNTVFVNVASAGNDGVSNSQGRATMDSTQSIFNGITWDRQRGNTEITVLATASRTVSTNSADLTNYNAKGVIITLEVTTDPGSGETLQLLVQHKDAEGSEYETLLDDGANATPGTRTVIVYPGVAGSANDVTSTAGYPLPRTFRVRIVHSASGTWAYTVGASLIL